MQERRTMGRREFTLASALAMLSGVVITVTGCGGGSGSPTSPNTPTPQSGDKVGSISANHGHSAIITAAELTAGGALNLDIRGSATHTHTVSLSAADIQAVAGGQRVSHESTDNDAHTHTVTFN